MPCATRLSLCLCFAPLALFDFFCYVFPATPHTSHTSGIFPFKVRPQKLRLVLNTYNSVAHCGTVFGYRPNCLVPRIILYLSLSTSNDTFTIPATIKSERVFIAGNRTSIQPREPNRKKLSTTVLIPWVLFGVQCRRCLGRWYHSELKAFRPKGENTISSLGIHLGTETMVAAVALDVQQHTQANIDGPKRQNKQDYLLCNELDNCRLPTTRTTNVNKDKQLEIGVMSHTVEAMEGSRVHDLIMKMENQEMECLLTRGTRQKFSNDSQMSTTQQSSTKQSEYYEVFMEECGEDPANMMAGLALILYPKLKNYQPKKDDNTQTQNRGSSRQKQGPLDFLHNCIRTWRRTNQQPKIIDFGQHSTSSAGMSPTNTTTYQA